MTPETPESLPPLRPSGTLSGKQRRQLRALGHHLNPLVLIGKEGLTEPICHQVNQELIAHELIKVRILDTAPDKASVIADVLSEMTNAHLAQVLGKTALLYREREENPEIVLEG